MLLPETVSIVSGPFSARLRPAWGGRMTHLTHAEFGNILVPTKADVFEPWNWPKAGAYPLFPYHNRLYGACFTHAGVSHDVLPHPLLAGDAMHGPAHRRPWRVARQANDQVTLLLDYEADAEWPFAFEASQSFFLNDHGLTVELSITNRAGVPAPFALGWHPYFVAGLDRDVRTDASLAYALDPFHVPTGNPPLPRPEASLPAKSGYTQHLMNWSTARFDLDVGYQLVLGADPVFHHLAAHRTEYYMCLEPVSMAAGTLCQPEHQRTNLGLTILQPGESLTGNIRLHIQSMLE
ncbi:aldose 1-epimerase [Rhizobium skierniewicense]|nr:aldose 1-epimerase [Rhizobium skierniewicense]